jgi:hypothetical protein
MSRFRTFLPGLVAWVVPLLLIPAAAADAQEFRGRINGVVTDNTGAVLPGVTVTATSPAMIQPQVQITGEDGTYRFIALNPGVYDLTYELPGFSTVKREGIRVVINQTLTVDQQLQVATLQETVTVTGESPVVDTSTTTVGTNFTKELLTEIPNARDIWAAMAQAPGMQMTAYDVGGSRTGTQTGFLTYGINQQNQTKIEGVDQTEGSDANAGYFDFGSFEEFQIGGAGNDASSYGSGATMNITVKSGADRVTGTWYSDWEGDATISDNVPEAFRTANNRDEDGFFSRTALTRGNPIDRQYDINANIGGPLWRRHLWGFYSYRLNDQYKYILGSDELARSKLSNQYTFKATLQLPRNNQIIGFLNKREKLQALRDFSPAVPISAARFQSSRNYPMKVEWTSVLNNKAFLDIIVANWENYFPLRPQDEVGTVSNIEPGRINTTNQNRLGYHDTYQQRKRFKPQFYASMSYFKDGWRGSHDFKFGYDWKNDRRKEGRDQPGNIHYRDITNAATGQVVVNDVDLYNGPNEGITDVEYHAGYINDTWKFSDRLTLNLGARVERYRDGWPDQEFTPAGIPALAGATDPRIVAFFAPQNVSATTVAEHTVFAPRAGFAYDLTGAGKTVLKGYYGRFYFNSSDTLANQENPVGMAQLRYQFLDQNGNRLLDNAQELGVFRQTVGGAGFVRVDRDIKRPYSQELSGHLEREIVGGLSGRLSYVYKNIRDDWDEVDMARLSLYTVPRTVTDPGADARPGQTSDDRQITLLDRSVGATAPTDRVWTNPEDYNSDFNTVEFAINRRFDGKWMALGSFGYTWLNQFHDSIQATTSAIEAASIEKDFDWQPNFRLFGKETSTLWNYKLIGRYTLPYEVGFSGSYKVQSGRNYGRVWSTPAALLPNAGTEAIRVEPIDTRRAPTVDILDFRVDKGFTLPNRLGRMVFMVDIFNALNRGTPTNFRMQTGTAVVAGETISTFQEVLGLLDPRIVRFGFRYEF